MVDSSILDSKISVQFLLDSLCFEFRGLSSEAFSYAPNPVLKPLNQLDPLKAYRYNPGSFIQLEVRTFKKCPTLPLNQRVPKQGVVTPLGIQSTSMGP